eukprot:XP_011451821.1 PREDICTED: uncharacterized protein LOC105345388 [Crassostrea gigas]
MVVHKPWLMTFVMVLLNANLSYASQILHPLGKPGIQPLVINITANQDTKTAMYYARFTGPSDTEALFFEGTFRKVSTSGTTSVFEAVSEFSFSGYARRRIFLESPSTADFLRVENDVDQSIYETEFARIPCEFEVKKSQDDGAGIVQYSVRAENCDLDGQYAGQGYESFKSIGTKITKSGEEVGYSLLDYPGKQVPPDYIFEYFNMTGDTGYNTGSRFLGTMTLNVKKMAADNVQVKPPMFKDFNVRATPFEMLEWAYMYII